MKRLWSLLLAASFAFGLAASWQRWANPVIDGGREMNQPLRIAQGETLYSDVGHIYGPLSPWLHAALYRAFGPSLGVLYADGIVSAIAILALVYALARRIMDPPAAAIATLLVMWLCAFKQSGNYIFPYAYSALHGTLFGLVTLLVSAAALERPSLSRFAVAGLAAGVTLLAKTEMGLAALCAGVAAAALAGSEDPAYNGGEDPAYNGGEDPAYNLASIAGRVVRSGGGRSVVGRVFRPGGEKPVVGRVVRPGGERPVVGRVFRPGGERPVVGRVFRPGGGRPVVGRVFRLGREKPVVGRAFRPGVIRAAVFLAAAVALSGAVYAVIAARVGWRTLVFDCWLLVYNVPAPLKVFNASVSGLDHPVQSLLRMSVTFVKIAVLVAAVGALAQFRAGPLAERRRAWMMLIAATALAVLLGVTTGLDWDRGPFLAMPIVLVLMIALAEERRQRIVVLYSLFALVALARVMLHVRSGGAYGSFLLPVSLIIFTYACVEPFPSLFGRPEVARAARALALGLLFAAAIGASIAVAERYRRSNTDIVRTARGTLIAQPEVAAGWNEALAFIDAHTRPGDPIVVLPEGTSLTFLSGRRNPLREEIVTPGFLDGAAEERAIRQIDAAGTTLILIVDRPTREFGAETFGRDYDRRLMDWIASRYEPCGRFGAGSLIRAYCRAPIRT